MKTKEKRQALELALIKSIEEILIKQHLETAKTIRKNTFEAAKKLSKKFYKTLKVLQPKTKSVKKNSSVPVKRLTVKRAKVNNQLTGKVAKKQVKAIVLKTGNKK